MTLLVIIGIILLSFVLSSGIIWVAWQLIQFVALEAFSKPLPELSWTVIFVIAIIIAIIRGLFSRGE